LKGFLAEFANGAHASEANAKLAEVEAQGAALFKAAEREAREMDAWAAASAAGTVAKLEDFRRDWPNSKYADGARKRIREINGAPSRRRLLQGVGVGVGMATVGGLATLEFQPGRLFWRLLYDQSIRTFAGHTDWVSSVAFSPDGQSALSGSGDKTLKLWDIATGNELRSVAGHTNDVHSVAFSPDGRSALSGSGDRTLRLWDVATGQQIRSFAGHTQIVNSVAFSPDDLTALSGSWDHTLKLWDVATGKELRSFVGHANRVDSVAFSPDGLTALSGSWDHTLKLWDTATGKELRSFVGHAEVNSVAFSPDARSALSGAERATVTRRRSFVARDANRGFERRPDWLIGSSPSGQVPEPEGLVSAAG
jgi:predicted NACHT family NTPase